VSDPSVPAMGIIFDKVCVLVTAAFALTLVPGFRQPERSLLSRRDQGTALLVFIVLGLVEEAAVGQTGLFNHRIVAVCAAGLLAGPGVSAPGANKRLRLSRNHDTVAVKQNPVRGCCASLGRHRHSHPPARPPHNIETPTGPTGRPS
jgi:hypothetical protein